MFNKTYRFLRLVEKLVIFDLNTSIKISNYLYRNVSRENMKLKIFRYKKIALYKGHPLNYIRHTYYRRMLKILRTFKDD